MCTTLIVPGLNGSAQGHWQRHWLRDRPEARLVDQDNWTCPALADWQTRLEAALEAAEGPVFIVAHSLGCILTASSAKRPAAKKVKGALLVAPADLERVEAMHPCVVSFGAAPLDALPFPSLVVGSQNDPYMSVDELHRHADAWGGDIINLGPVGHINIASGFGRWKEGYRIFDGLKRGVERRNLQPAAPFSFPNPREGGESHDGKSQEGKRASA